MQNDLQVWQLIMQASWLVQAVMALLLEVFSKMLQLGTVGPS